jgi:hypothetical protein
MQTIELIGSGDVAIGDQLAEMKEWLHEAGIETLSLEALCIIKGNVRFRASFATADDAERFCRRFATTAVISEG